jgi:hypothetical protein
LRTARSLSAGHDPHGMYDVGDVAQGAIAECW